MHRYDDNREKSKRSWITEGVKEIRKDFRIGKEYQNASRNQSSSLYEEFMEAEKARVKWMTKLMIAGTVLMVGLYLSGFFMDALAKAIRSGKNIRRAIRSK